VRASATSRISSAHLHAAQNKPDANKADDASPFALLVQPPKDAAKPSHKDTSSEDKPADDSRAVKKDGNTSDTNQAQAKPVQPAKTDPSDKTDEKAGDKIVEADKGGDAAQTVDTLANLDQVAPPQPQLVNPQIQQAAQPVLASANDEEGDAEEITAVAKTPNTKTAQQTPQNNPVPAAPAAPAASTAPATPTSAAPATPTSAAPATPTSAAPATPTEDQAQDTQAAASQALADKTLAAKPAAKPASIKTADIKPEGAKPARASTDNQTAANTADTKADAANAALNDKAAATQDIAVSRQAHADINHLAVNALTAPQAQQQPAQAASLTQQVTQYVQVTTQPTPNVPALAVEIAAKSLGGARQFDIRLDPPELGRVEVRLSIDATGKASAHLSADQPRTLDLLQKDAPALTRALREAGLDVSQDGLNFSLRHQGSQDGHANNGGNRGTSRSFNLSATTSIDATATSAAYRSVADGRLDIRV
jgi:flagellar hook-length control protein FliK